MAYKLTYFNLMGLGEPIRYLLHYGGINFEDVRVNFEEWPTVKPTIKFGQLPVLEVDGKTLNQSTAICRYLGKQLKLSGKNDWESAEIDAVVDTIQDMRAKISAYFYGTDPEDKKAKMLEVLLNETLPFYMEKLNTLAKENNNHFVGGQLSWGDVFFVGIMEYITVRLNQDILEKYPNLNAMRENIRSQPGIKEWIAKRPQTPF